MEYHSSRSKPSTLLYTSSSLPAEPKNSKKERMSGNDLPLDSL